MAWRLTRPFIASTATWLTLWPMLFGRGKVPWSSFGYHEEARLTWDALAKAPEVKVPTLILCGADDDVNRRGSTPVGTARRLGELVPGAELALIPGVRHMTFWDGDGALKALQDFLSRHPIGWELMSEDIEPSYSTGWRLELQLKGRGNRQ